VSFRCRSAAHQSGEVLLSGRTSADETAFDLVEAQRILRTIAKRKRAPKSPFPDLALFRQEYDALGPMKVRRLLDDMRTIEHCLREVEHERFREDIERSRLEAARKADFTDAERRLILSTLHPDANASPERREAAFKAFNAKRSRQTQS
jgi:hypothetical protein